MVCIGTIRCKGLGECADTCDDTGAGEGIWGNRSYVEAAGHVINLGVRQRTTLNQVLVELQQIIGTSFTPLYESPRVGDVRHSLADITRAERLLGFRPVVDLREGLRYTVDWYRENQR